MADVVTYNTVVKKHSRRRHAQSARGVIETMRLAGGDLKPNTVTFTSPPTWRAGVDRALALVETLSGRGERGPAQPLAQSARPGIAHGKPEASAGEAPPQ